MVERNEAAEVNSTTPWGPEVEVLHIAGAGLFSIASTLALSNRSTRLHER